MEKIKELMTSKWMYAIGALLGALGGYIYYAEIGCLTGNCPIKSSPWAMIIWGTVLGALVFSMLKRERKVVE